MWACHCFYHRMACVRLVSLAQALPLRAGFAQQNVTDTTRMYRRAALTSPDKISSLLPRASLGEGLAWRQRKRIHLRAVHWRDTLPPPKPDPPEQSADDDTEDVAVSSKDRTNAKRGATSKSKDEVVKQKAEAKRAKLNRKALNSAAGLVGWRPRSERELRDKLAEKEHDEEAIEAAIFRIQELELESKGLMSQDIDAALQEVFGDDMAVSLQHKGYDDEDDDDKFNTTDTRFEPKHHLIYGAQRQAELSQGLKPETRKRRLVMWLQRRGHTWSQISAVLTHVDLE